MTQLILASGSIVRARLLKSAGVEFDVVPAHVDEAAVKASLQAEGAEPRGIAEALAELKALRVSTSRPQALVLGADQILAFQGETFGKSENLADAKKMLARLRGRTHELIGATVLARDGSAIWRHVDRCEMRMRAFSDVFLDDYLAREGETILDAIGGYHFEGRGAQLFQSVAGDYFSILGLPLLAVLAQLREQGVLLK